MQYLWLNEEEFINKTSRKFRCMAFLDGVELKGKIIKFKYHQASNADSYLCLGSSCSAYFEIDYLGNETILPGKTIRLFVDINRSNGHIPPYYGMVSLGPHSITKVEKNGNTVSILAYDDLSAVSNTIGMDRYSVGDFTNTYMRETYGIDILATYVNDDFYKQITSYNFKTSTKNMKDKELLGYSAQLYGMNVIPHNGGYGFEEKKTIYEYRWYDEHFGVYKITPDHIYEFKKNGDLYSLDKLECIVEKEVNGETVKEKLKAGLGTGGISFSNPFMTQDILNKIYGFMGGLVYQPCTLKILGDPRLEVGDIVTVVDTDGKEYKVPIMAMDLEYDGGITTTITSYGGSDGMSSSSGPTAQAIEKVYVKMYEADRVVADKVTAAEGEIKKLSGDYLDFIEGEFETLKSDTAEFKNTTTESLKAVNANIGSLTGEFADFKELTTTDLTATNANISKLSGDFASFKSGEFETLKSDTANFKKTTTESLTAINANITNLSGDFATFKTGEFETLKAKQATFEETTTKKFTAVTAQIETVTGDFASFKTGEFETLKSKQAAFEEATAQKFTAVNGNIDNLTGQFATFKELTTTNFTAVTGNIKDLTVESQRVKTLLAGNITADNIATGAITAGSGIIAEGAIGDAEISDLSANKIKSGTVDTSLVTIASKDSAITITGNQLMVNDTTNAASPINRVILGKYTNGSATTYGLLIRGKDGKTVMLDGDGVHNAGITNGAVDNNKVADDANISGNKLDINSVVRSVNGATEKIQSTVVQVGDRSLNVYLGEQTNTITEHGESLRTQAASIKAAQDSIKLKLDTQTWTTAKEEIDGKISKNTSNLSKATSDITVLQGQITSKVEQTDINKAVESIHLGVRNILPNRKDFWEQGSIYTGGGRAPSGTRIRTKNKIKVFPNTQYVLNSFGSGIIAYHQWSDGSYLNDSGWITAYPHFFTTAPNAAYIEFVARANNGSETSVDDLGTIHIYKIEKGTKATDWSPAPEDTDSKIAEVITNTTESIKAAKSEIKQTTDAITQNVSNLQTTVSTHTTQIGNKAETSTVTAISNRTASLETKLTGITGKVTDYVSTTVTDSTKDLVTGLETVNGSIETINSKQANFELTLSGFATDVSNLEKTVEKKADGSALSTLSSTVSNLSSNLDGFKTSVSSTYTTKTELSNTLGSYSTTKQMNSAIEASKTAITSSVSETYSTKAELTTATGKITALETWKQEASQKITKDGIVSTVGSYYAKDTDLTAAENRITSVETKATQTADKFNWIVKSGTSATDFTITDRLISLATARIDLSATNLVNIISGGSAKIQAKNITLDGVVTANSNFKILADGSVEAKNGKFIGEVDATKLMAKDKYSIYPANWPDVPIDILSATMSLPESGKSKQLWIGLDVGNATSPLYQKGITLTKKESNSGGANSYDTFINGDEMYIDFARSDLRFGTGNLYIGGITEGGVALKNKYAPISHTHNATDVITDADHCFVTSTEKAKLGQIALNAGNGYTKLSDGTLIQWGMVRENIVTNAYKNTAKNITFPYLFGGNCPVTVNVQYENSSYSGVPWVDYIDYGSCRVVLQGATAANTSTATWFRWMAIGRWK